MPAAFEIQRQPGLRGLANDRLFLQRLHRIRNHFEVDTAFFAPVHASTKPCSMRTSTTESTASNGTFRPSVSHELREVRAHAPVVACVVPSNSCSCVIQPPMTCEVRDQHLRDIQ
jgi:hypothetical protein